MEKKTNTKAWIIVAILSLYGYLAYRLVDLEQWQALKDLVEDDATQLTVILFLQMLLLLVNLLLESIKWRFMTKPIRNISQTEAFETILAAMALGNITPARAGEHIGRSALAPQGHRSLSIALSLMSSIAQTTIITLMFALSLPFITTPLYSIPTELSAFNPTMAALAMAIATASIVLVVMKKDNLRRIILKTRVLFIRQIANARYLWVVNILSLLRYLVFSSQLLIMLWALQPQVDLGQLAMLIPSYFFTITMIPSFFLADIGIKGSVALFIFSSQHASSELSILTAMFMIWIINSAIPTLIGNIVITKKHKHIQQLFVIK